MNVPAIVAAPKPKTVLDPTKSWTPTSTRSLHTLPSTIIYRILKYISNADIRSLARVTQRLYRVVNPVVYERHFQQFHKALKCLFINDQTMVIRHFAQAAVKYEGKHPASRQGKALQEPSWASMKRSELVVDILLSTDDLTNLYANEACQTPLSLAAETGNVRLVKDLLLQGADVNAIDSAGNYGRTPLISALSPPIERSNAFILPSARSESQLDLPWSPRRITTQGISLSEVRIAMGLSAIRYPDPTARYRAYKRRKARYDEHFTGKSPHKQILHQLLGGGADLELRDRLGRSPLIYAVAGGSVPVAELLIMHGANVNGRGGLPSPLFHAAANGDVEMVHLLLANGANTLPRSREDPWSPLWIAAKNGHFNIVEALLSHPVEKPYVNNKVTTWEPLRDAAKRGHARVVRTLIEYRKDNWPNLCLGEEGLFWAAYGGWERVFRILLDAGAPLSGPCESLDGISILSAAVMGRNSDIIKELLAMKPELDIEARDKHGWSAVDWARRTYNKEVEGLFRRGRLGGGEAFNRLLKAPLGPLPHTKFLSCVP
ncbi:ankyrin repeat-containing domain protein [Aspergillus carlsbadensis]|nr:ankyrin repeat-containing domain protein [Aspergillus carlsbadensis]